VHLAWPIAVVLCSVTVGTLLGAAVGGRGLGVARVVSSIAAAAAVFQLLPDAWEALGTAAMLAAGFAYALPSLLERARPDRGQAHELAFAGLLAHQVVDGIGLALFRQEPSVMLALAAHLTPMTAAVVLAFGGDRRAALRRGVPMGGAVLVGVGLGGLAPSAWVEASEPWLTAIAAGLLLHIASHGVGHKHDDHDDH